MFLARYHAGDDPSAGMCPTRLDVGILVSLFPPRQKHLMSLARETLYCVRRAVAARAQSRTPTMEQLTGEPAMTLRSRTRAMHFLGHLHSHISSVRTGWCVGAELCSATACEVAPTTDTSTALRNFEEDGFCILKGVLSPAQVAMYRDHLLGVMGDLTFLDNAGRRRDPATACYTEPSVVPPRDERSYTLFSEDDRFTHVNAGQGQHWHNGDFGGRYGDELRLMVEGYVRHDPRWAQQGCDNARVRAVIEPLLGDDFRVVYTDGAVDYPGASALGWHSDGPILNFNGKTLDASPRITSLWMLSDFTAENGCVSNSNPTQTVRP